MRELLPKSYFLVPGYGAQGATAKDIANAFNDDGLGAIVNSSRGIMCAWKKTGHTARIIRKPRARKPSACGTKL